MCVLYSVLTKDSLIVNQVEVDHGYGRPDTQQGQDDEPGEEAAAAGPGVWLLPILIGCLGFSTICNTRQCDRHVISPFEDVICSFLQNQAMLYIQEELH